MNKRIDFTILGGLPYVQETFDWMQDSYRKAFTSIAQLLGDKVIVSGCQVVGGNVTDGWITYNGELVRFVGGAYVAGDQVSVADDTTSALNPATYGDNTVRTIYYEKLAKISTPGLFPFTDLKPANIGVPVGTVLMWSGNVAVIPTGFALCDGTNGTPDLRGRFIVGYDPTDVDYNTISNSGGEKKYKLQPGEQGNIQWRVRSDDGDDSVSNYKSIAALEINGTQQLVSGFGIDQWSPLQTSQLNNTAVAHENRPPYYTLAYIIKL